MKNIVITIPVTDEDRILFEQKISDRHDDFRIIYSDGSSGHTDIIRSASAIIGMIEPSAVQGLTLLEWLQIPWAGVEQYVQRAVLPKKTILTNASGAYGISVAEHMVALTLALSCHLDIYLRQQGQHVWKQHGRELFIGESTVLVLGLDVFEEEPLQKSPLWDMQNVIITPHVAGKMEDGFNRKKVLELCANNLYRYTHGLDLMHVVDRDKGY